jgi:hypothetical protein
MNIHPSNRLWRQVSLIGVLLLLLALVVVDLFFGADEVGVEGRALPRLLRLVVFGIMFIWVISEEHEYSIGLSFGFSVLLLGLVMGISVIVASKDLKTDMIDLSKTYYWILGFFFMAGMARRGVLTPRMLTYFTIPLVLMLFLKILILDRLSGAADAAVADYRNDGWKLVLCVPLILVIDPAKKKQLYLCLILVVVAALVSLKRGAILALAGSMACWLLASTGNTLRAKLITVLKVIGIVAIASLVVISRQDQYAGRLDDISSGNIEDMGSGRGLSYGAVWRRIERADGLRLVVGHGYAAVPNALWEDIGVRVYAHSDLLEVFYDHGVIGVLVMLMMLASLIRLWLVLRRIDPILSTAVLCAIPIVVSKGLISIAIYDPSMIHMAMALGYVQGRVAWDADIAVSGDFSDAAEYEMGGYPPQMADLS